MGTKTLIKLLIALALIGGLAAILQFSNPGGVDEVTSSTDKRKVFQDFPINEVAAITIQAKDKSLNLAKGETTWEVAERDDYPANAEPIIELLRTLWDLNIAQPVTIGRAQFGRLSLIDPGEAASEDEAATILTFKGSDGEELTSLWLGKVYERSQNSPSPFGGPGMATTDAGRYIKPGNTNSVYLVGETFGSINTDAADWIDMSFFKVEKVKTIEIQTKDKANDWRLTRKDVADDFSLVDAAEDEMLDPAKTTSMRGAFSNPAIEDVYTKEEAKDLKTDATAFKISTFDGFNYVISLGEKNDLNEMPMTVKVSAKLQEKREAGEDESEEDKERLDKTFEVELGNLKTKLANEKKLEGHVYKVRSFVTDSINKTRADLMVTEEEPAAEGTEVAPGVSLPGLPPGVTLPPGLGGGGN